MRITAFEGQGINITGVSCGNEHSLFVSDTHHVYGCGLNSQGQLGVQTIQQDVREPHKVQGVS